MHRVSIFGNWAWITWWGFSRKEQRCWLGKHWAKYLIKRHHLWLLIKETVSWTNRDLWSGLLPGIYSFLQGWVGFSGKLNYPFLRSSPRMVKSLKIQLAWTPTLTMQKSVMTIFNFLDVCHQSPSFRSSCQLIVTILMKFPPTPQKLCNDFFRGAQDLVLVQIILIMQKNINIARGTTDPGYWVQNLNYL